MSTEKAKKWDGRPHLKIVSPEGKVLHDGPTSRLPTFQDYQACLEVAEAIKTYGRHEDVPKDVWRDIIERMCVRMGLKGAPAQAPVPESLDLKKRYLLAVADKVAGTDPAKMDDARRMGLALLNQESIPSLKEWSELWAIANG